MNVKIPKQKDPPLLQYFMENHAEITNAWSPLNIKNEEHRNT